MQKRDEGVGANVPSAARQPMEFCTWRNGVEDRARPPDIGRGSLAGEMPPVKCMIAGVCRVSPADLPPGPSMHELIC